MQQQNYRQCLIQYAEILRFLYIEDYSKIKKKDQELVSRNILLKNFFVIFYLILSKLVKFH